MSRSCDKTVVDTSRPPYSQLDRPNLHKGKHTDHHQPPWMFTLAFRDKGLEALFRKSYDQAARSHDEQAASVYLWMVALGSLLYLVVTAYSPASRPANVDKCSVLILCSWLGPMAHLLLLRLLPRAVYIRYRTRIILLLRAFYIGATSINGFGLCGVGPLQDKGLHVPLLQQQQQHHTAAIVAFTEPAAAAPPLADPAAAGGQCSLESPFSAMLWRSGVIGLIWWGAAFPLLFQHHIVVQAASVALYGSTLTRTVCGTMSGVRSGWRVLSSIHHVCHSLVAQMLASVGVRGLSTHYAKLSAAAAAAAAATARSSSSSSSSSSYLGGSGCRQALMFVQLVLGLVLPAFVMYCFEARKRYSWWRGLHPQVSEPTSINGSSSSSQPAGTAAPATTAAEVLEGSSAASLAALEEAAMASLAALAADCDPLKPQAAAGKARLAAAAVAAVQPDCTAAVEGSGSSSSSTARSVNRSDSAGSQVSHAGSSSSSSYQEASRRAHSKQQQEALPERMPWAKASAAAAVAAAAAGTRGGLCCIDEASLLAAVDASESSYVFGSSSTGQPHFLAALLVLLVVSGVSWMVIGQVLQ